MDPIAACLNELRERRARIDKAIQSLAELQTSPETTVERKPTVTTTTPGKKARRSRGRPRKQMPNGGSAALMCLECAPPSGPYKSALALSQHKRWRHIGRKGQERSLIGSSLMNN